MIATVSAIDLTKLSYDALYKLSLYWHSRLECRGGSWISHTLKDAAMDMLQEIDQELQRREALAAL